MSSYLTSHVTSTLHKITHIYWVPVETLHYLSMSSVLMLVQDYFLQHLLDSFTIRQQIHNVFDQYDST